jgi:hypothetical protein
MLTIPATLQKRIENELLTLPAICGKLTLTITLNCTSSKVVGSMKIIRSIEEEVRP